MFWFGDRASSTMTWLKDAGGTTNNLATGSGQEFKQWCIDAWETTKDFLNRSGLVVEKRAPTYYRPYTGPLHITFQGIKNNQGES